MTTTAFIYIQDLTATEFQWFDGLLLQTDSIENIAAKLPQKEIVLVLSGQQVYLSNVDLPNANLNQLQKAAPFALEEELAQDIEQLHFTFGTIVKNQTVSVAVIDKTFLSTCISKFEAVDLSIQACYTAPLLFPHKPFNWTCAVQNETAFIKINNAAGFTVPTQHLLAFIESQLGIATMRPQSIQYYRFSSQEISLPPAFAEIPVQTIEKNADDFFPMLAEQIQKNQCGINLLQGQFKAAKKTNRVKKAWLLAGACCAIWILVSIVSTCVSSIYYNKQHAKLTQQIDAIYMRIFPEATAIVSPKTRMERELQKYQQGNNDAGFLSMLEKLGPIIKNANYIVVKQLAYHNQTITLNLQTRSFEELQRFSDALKTTGLTIQQTSATNKGKLVTANFRATFENNS